MKKTTLWLFCLFFSLLLYAGDKDSTKNSLAAADNKKLDHLTAVLKTLDSAEKNTHYQTGTIAQ